MLFSSVKLTQHEWSTPTFTPTRPRKRVVYALLWLLISRIVPWFRKCFLTWRKMRQFINHLLRRNLSPIVNPSNHGVQFWRLKKQELDHGTQNRLGAVYRILKWYIPHKIHLVWSRNFHLTTCFTCLVLVPRQLLLSGLYSASWAKPVTDRAAHHGVPCTIATINSRSCINKLATNVRSATIPSQGTAFV